MFVFFIMLFCLNFRNKNYRSPAMKANPVVQVVPLYSYYCNNTFEIAYYY